MRIKPLLYRCIRRQLPELVRPLANILRILAPGRIGSREITLEYRGHSFLKSTLDERVGRLACGADEMMHFVE